MVSESAIMLCSPFDPGIAPYKRGWYNHPCTKWTRASEENYEWHLEHALALANEYKLRYNRRHASHAVIEWCLDSYYILRLPKIGMTDFAQAMPDDVKNKNAVVAYRNYYRRYKYEFARWEKGREKPAWFDRQAFSCLV